MRRELPPAVLQTFSANRENWCAWLESNPAMNYLGNTDDEAMTKALEAAGIKAIDLDTGKFVVEWVSPGEWIDSSIRWSFWRLVQSVTRIVLICPDCNGSRVYRGLFVEEPCKTCKGSGKVG